MTQRIADDGAAAWQIHYRVLELREQGVDVLLLSVGDPDFDTPQPIVQVAIASLLLKIWQELASLCIRHDLWLISDEVYSDLLFEGVHISPASLPGMAERTATINSLSKSPVMSGWRVGWVIGPKTMADHLEYLSLCMLFGVPEFIQNAAQLALDEDLPEVALMREEYRQRRDLICESLGHCPGIRPIRPDGGMYVMVDVRQTGLSAQDFAERLLEGYGVSGLASEAFGASAAGHIRLGLVVNRQKLADACRRIALCAMDLMQPRADFG